MPIKPQILVVGGAGYIGSHMVRCLAKANFEPIVLDNLSTGHRDAVGDAIFIQGEAANKNLLANIFATYSISAVMHFASLINVAESVAKPLLYYQNNIAAALNLLEMMLENDVRHLIFSSTAAVYGQPLTEKIKEDHPLSPINPYGRSKQMLEAIIQDVAQKERLHFAILRYFNAAGADPSGELGERHLAESHLIPLALQTAQRQHPYLTIFGDDYPTPDGTNIRDFIHVADLCQAHLLALTKLLQGQKAIICNLGTGRGYSVKEVIQTIEKITQLVIPLRISSRRPGDPAILVADASLAEQILGWQPVFSDLRTIIQHAWSFIKMGQTICLR